MSRAVSDADACSDLLKVVNALPIQNKYQMIDHLKVTHISMHRLFCLYVYSPLSE